MDENRLRQYSNMVGETGSILDVAPYEVDYSRGMFALSDERVVAIHRVRYIGWTREFPVWDLSYCHGRLGDGTVVQVDVGGQFQCPAPSLRVAEAKLKERLVDTFKAAGRHGKKMGVFDTLSILPG